jgi:hypothetical protein
LTEKRADLARGEAPSTPGTDGAPPAVRIIELTPRRAQTNGISGELRGEDPRARVGLRRRKSRPNLARAHEDPSIAEANALAVEDDVAELAEVVERDFSPIGAAIIVLLCPRPTLGPA